MKCFRFVFWNLNKNQANLVSPFYLINSHKKKIWKIKLFNSPNISCYEIPPCYLGFIDNGTDNYPILLFLDGPKGSGSFSTVKKVFFIANLNKWEHENIYVISGTRNYSYDDKQKILTFKGEKISSNEEIIDLKKIVFNGMNN